VKTHQALGEKGARLLALLASEIRERRFVAGDPGSFMSYSEALDKLGVPRRGRAGRQLQREGLTELNEWTRQLREVPKIAGLIVDKKHHRPGPGFAASHGHTESNWEAWWLAESAKAIGFKGWGNYLEAEAFSGQTLRSAGALLREEPGEAADYRQIITLEPGKRGGRPCIRGLRITVADVLGWLAAGMSHEEIRSDFPELTKGDIRACLAFAAAREQHAVSLPA